MSKSMLVNVTAEEENRVAIVENGVLDLFEIETLSRGHLKGNIFKALVDGVNSALEAAFVNYGGEKAGFLPVDEVNFKLYPSRNGGSGGKGRGSRITRHLEKGMEVLVQVIRDSYASKPPTLSTYYSLPGRYLVLMPGADAAGISRKIEDEEQRGRLRKVLEELSIPEGYGVIVRTAGTETSPRDLQADLDALLELWRNIEEAGSQVKAPALIYQERDLVVRTTRDSFTSDIQEVLIDDEPTFQRVKRFFEVHMPDSAELVKLYTGDKPIFSKHNIEDQIERIYKRVVQLKSGGSIAIDQTEALTAIDVNSARSVRSASSEDTALRTNLEAADEIARQLRLRDIGGLIVIDFIDMEAPKHNRQVERAFNQAMSNDKARYDVTRISKLGLMEVSRQRMKSAKASSSFMECPVCAGDGTIRSPEAAARSAFRKIQSRVARGELAVAKVYLPPDVALYLLNQKRDDLYRLETRHQVQIEVVIQEQMQPDQFEIEEVRREEEDIAPIVTAEKVDQAIADGTLTRTPRVEEAASPAEEPSDGKARKGRRRRRRRRTPATEAGDAAATASPAVDEDGPVFSEGPEADERPAGAAQPDEPQADEAVPAADGQRAPRRRRRRRRRRVRVGPEKRPGDVDEEASEASQGSIRRPAPDFSEEREGDAVAAAPPPESLGAAPRGRRSTSSPALPFLQSESSRPAAGTTGLETPQPVADAPAAEGDAVEPKPKRRWWRRPFRG